MKRTSILLTLLMLATLSTWAQRTLITGTLADSLTLEGEPYATVRVYKQKEADKPVAMSVTDADGHIRQEVNGKGTYVITFTGVGRAPLSRTLTLRGEPSVDLGTLYVSDDALMLDGVEIVAHAPLVKMETDKMSYNVQEDVDAQSNSVLDMLRKVPMVTVDGQDNITVNGSSSFTVYVDGKPNAMFSSNPSQVFKSMPASSVKSIEVVTNPGARYDAEGVGGVLNLVMARDGQAGQSLNGLNGTLRATANSRGAGGAVFVGGQQGRLSFSANAMFNYMHPGETLMTTDRTQDDADAATTHIDMGTRTRIPFYMGNLTLGYEVDSMSTVNATFGLTSFNMRNNGTMHTAFGTAAASPFYGYDSHLRLRNSNLSLNASLDYQRFLNPARTRSVTLSYLLSHRPGHSRNTTTFPQATADETLTDRFSDNDTRATEHTLQVDYTTPLAEGHSLSLGAKYVHRDNDSEGNYYDLDSGERHFNEDMSTDYNYTNDIAAAYAEYEGKAGKASLKAGLRYEHTWQKATYRLGSGEDFSKNYGNLVPSVSLGWQLAPTRNVGLTYNLRISRPGISYLNPYVDRSNPTSLSYGNTGLDVEKGHNIGLVYNHFSQKFMLNASLRQSLCDNGIEQYSFYEDGLLNTTYGNIVRRRQTSLNVYANWSATTTTRLIVNAGGSYTDLHSNRLGLSNNGWQANLMLGVQQTLPWSLKLSANLMTSTKSYTLQGWNSGFNLLMGNLSKSLCNDRLTISLGAVTGLSDGGKLKFEGYSRGKDFTSHQTTKVPMQSVMLSATFAFGKSKAQARQHQSRVQSDVMEQQSQGEMLNSTIGM